MLVTLFSRIESANAVSGAKVEICTQLAIALASTRLAQQDQAERSSHGNSKH
eukprot:XP_001692834.1 predicted protein [Chlamydomonas reinhardtii]